MSSDTSIRVETVELDSVGSRQIRSRNRPTELLDERRAEIQEAISAASSIAQESLTRMDDRQGFQITSMEVAFGLTLAAEAGVVVGKASTEASFEVTITVERN